MGHRASDGWDMELQMERRQKSGQCNIKIVLEEMGWMSIKQIHLGRLQQMASSCELGQSTVHVPCIVKTDLIFALFLSISVKFF